MTTTAELTPLLALAAGGSFLAVNAWVATRPPAAHPPSWLWPALAAGAFAAFSVAAMLSEGALGFWHEHSQRGLWGNQIWFDLLLAASTAFVLALPRLRAQGMRPWLWLLLIAASGSIGLMAMLARLWYLEQRG
jgi:hypothetical protein